MKTTIEERILLHLKNYSETIEGRKAPFYVSQKGIAEAIDGSISQVSRVLKRMEGEGLVKVKRKYIKHNHNRTKKIYYLAAEGNRKEKKLRNELMKETIEILTEDSNSKIKISELCSQINNENPLLYIVMNISENNILDLTEEKEKKEYPFVNRKDELSTLKDELDKVRNKGCSFISIKGTIGSGKTVLIKEFEKYIIEEDFKFFKGKGYYETLYPFIPLKEAFGDHDKIIEKLSPIDILNGEDNLRKFNLSDEIYQQGRYFQIFEFTKKVKKLGKENPFILFIDNLQWVDKSTLHLLSYMVNNLNERPILIITAYRPEDIGKNHPVKNFLINLSKKKNYKEIEIDTLTFEDIKDIISYRLNLKKVPLDFVEFVLEFSEGKPFFVKELINLLSEEKKLPTQSSNYPTNKKEITIPENVENVFARRKNLHITEKGQKLLTIGSIIGEEIPVELIYKCCEFEEMEFWEGIDELLEKEIWKENPENDSFIFQHNLMTSVTYKNIPETKKRRFHNLVARNIQDLYVNNIEDYHSDLGYHYEKANKFKEAVYHYQKGGLHAEKFYAYENAINMYERALELTEDSNLKLDLFEKIGRIYKILGEYNKSIEKLREAFEKTDQIKTEQRILAELGDVYIKQRNYEKAMKYAEKGLSINKNNNKFKCKLLKIKGKIYYRKGNHDKSKQIFLEEKSIAEKIDSNKEIAQALHYIGLVERTLGKMEESIESLNQTTDIFKEIDDKIGLSNSLNVLGTVYKRKGDFEEAFNHFKKALELNDEINYKSGKVKALNNIGIVYKNQGNLEKSLEYYKKSLKISEKINDQLAIGRINTNIGTIFIDKNNFEDALEYLKKGLKIQREISDKIGMAGSLNDIGHIYHLKGEFQKALENYNKSLGIGEEIGDKNMIGWTLNNIGSVYEDMEQYEKALDYYEKCYKLNKKIEDNHLEFHLQCGLATVYLALDKNKVAFEHAEKGLNIGKQLKSKKEKALAHKTLGEIYRKMEDIEKADDEFKKALKIFEDHEIEKGYYRVIYEQGILFMKNGRTKKASQKLEEAKKGFKKFNMDWWFEKSQKSLERID